MQSISFQSCNPSSYRDGFLFLFHAARMARYLLYQSMTLALSVWNGRIAPVFDVSERWLIFSGGLEGPLPEPALFPSFDADDRARFLSGRGVTHLVCGALSREYEDALLDQGIEALSFAAGPVARILEALKAGTLEQELFSMPGCGCPRRRCRRRGQGHRLGPALGGPQ